MHQDKWTFGRREFLVGSAALVGASALPAIAAGDKAKSLSATVNSAIQRPPVSAKIYGGFLEHIGNLINHSLWSEVLDDRKFYYGVLAKPETKPADPRAARGFIQKWTVLGPFNALSLDTDDPYVGEHSPIINSVAHQARGMAQHGLVLRKNIGYQGRIVLSASRGVEVTLSLIWGAGANQRASVKVPAGEQWQTQTFTLPCKGQTDQGQLHITAKGKGHCRVGAVSLMPQDNVKGFRADTLALMKEMDCQILRMPGGNFVSAYDWENTIGDPDKRPPVLDPVWSAVQPNDVGVDELLQLCELIECEPYWCVNTGFGEPRSGANILEYINGDASTPWGKMRAANGHTAPYGVKYWAVGNEMYGHWQMGHMARDQYVVKHNLFVDAMRKVDPSIYIVAPGGFVDEMTTGQGIFVKGQPQVEIGSERDWAYGMFKDCWGKFDALGTHAYPPENKRFNLKTGELFDVKTTLNEWARQPANRVRTMFDAWQQYKKRFPKLNEGQVKVFFDEWAYHFHDDLKGALACALTLHEFFRHTDFIDMAGYTMATNWLDFNRTDSVINTKGRLFQLYHQHFGTIPVEVGGNAPTPAPKYPIGGDQPRVNAGSATYPLDVSAALSQDHKTLVIAVVNATEQPHDLALEVSGFRAAPTGRCLKFTGSSVDAANTLTTPAQVMAVESTFDTRQPLLSIAPISVELYKLPMA